MFSQIPEQLLFVHVEMYYEGVGNPIAHEFGITGDFPRVSFNILVVNLCIR